MHPPDQVPGPGGGDYLIENVVVARVEVGGQQHELLESHGPALLHLHRHVVDEEGRRVVLWENVDGELVPDAVTAIADAEDDVVTGGVAVGVMVDDSALLQVPHAEHKCLPTWEREEMGKNENSSKGNSFSSSVHLKILFFKRSCFC